MNKQIEALRKLGFNDAEIRQILNDDAQVDRMKDSEVNNDLTAEQQKVSKEMKQADRKKSTATVKRERKANNDKRFLIETIASAVGADVEIVNPEREITFTHNGTKYKVVLSQPRK